MPPTLRSNQPVNTTQRYGREAEVSTTRDLGSLALLGGIGLGAYGLATHEMPEWLVNRYMRNPRMLGWGLREATTTGLESSIIYARKFGLGEFASGLPKWRWGEFGMNLAKMAEEISPSQILRTFGLYEHMTAITTRRGITYRFSPEEAMAHREYLSELVGRHLRRREMLGGVTLEGGSLWLERNLAGEREMVLRRAHLMTRRYVPRGAADQSFWHFGKIAPAYEETITGGRRLMPSVKLGLRPDEAMTSSFLIGGGHTRTQATWRYLQATTRTWTQRFFKLMDDPFLGMMEAFIGEPGEMPTGMLSKTMHAGQRAFKAARLQGRFGLGGVYTGSTMEMIGRWMLPERMHAGRFIETVGQTRWRFGAIAALVGIPLAYHAIDQFLAGSEIVPTGGEGIGGLAARTYQGLTMLRAQTLGRVVGPIARAQEEVAPGSTKLTAALAPVMAGGLTGATAGYATRLFGSLTGDPTAALERARTPQRMGPLLSKIWKGSYSRTTRYGLRGLAIGAALAAPMWIGAAARLLGGLETPAELEELYAGRREVPIMASRWWTFGRTPYEGKKPEYYAPHWTVRARARYKDAALFTGKESWLFKAIKKTPLLQDMVDPYYFEKLHYETRPYPVTGPSDVGLGFLDSIYKATIGRIFKPVRYMHTEEWMDEEGRPKAWEPRPMLAPDSTLGGTAPYKPRDPYAYDQIAKKTLEDYSDAIGIIGWLGRLGVRAAVGETTAFDVQPELESAARIGGIKRAYWDASIGDPFGVTEAYRRLNPSRTRGQYYSPIANKMPEWLPGEEYFINFRTGDPYAKIKRGEARLPGPGYEALHTELRGINPEDYPEFYKFKILADVAPYSAQFKHYNRRMSHLAKQGLLNEEERKQVKTIRKQTRSIKQRKEFAEYMTEEDLREMDASIVGRTAADYWDIVSRLETPVEQIMFPPVAPMAKFVHRRTALEDYERSQVYGTDMSFWNRVYDNFLRPGMWSTARLMGYKGVPPHVRRMRDIEEYFDKLEYIKNKRLQRAAEEIGDAESAQMYWEKTRETMVGMNPYGNPLWILRAMPKRERDYWKAFQAEDDPEKQARIMELVPEGLREIYRAAWLRRTAKDVGAAKRKRILSEKDQAEADRILKYVEEDMRRQGQPYSEDTLDQFKSAVRFGRVRPHKYADWYRQKEMEEYFQSHKLPDEGWIGWDPRVDLEDVKMKFVREEGYDFHDYDLWEDRLYALTRKPYLKESTRQLDTDVTESSYTTQRRLRALLNSYDPEMLSIIPTLNGEKVEIHINDTKRDRLTSALSGARLK